MSTKLQKFNEPAITKYVTLLTNQVLNTDIFPDKLNIAKVIPIYKKVTQYYLPVIGQYPFYRLFKKFLKSLLLTNCLRILMTLKVSLITSMVFVPNILSNMLHYNE